MKQNNFAFIDSQNVNLAVKAQGWTLDFARFRIYLRDKYQVNKAFLFIGYVAGNEARYTRLQEQGYIVIFKPTLERKLNAKIIVKGNVDAELVLHSMIEYPNYDQAVIVSGDGDFHCLVDYLATQNKLKKLLIPNRYKYSALLRKFVSNIDFMNDLRKKVGKSKEGH